MSIHPSSIISSKAKIHPEVEIGPFCIIRGDVTLGSGTVLESHVSIGSESSRVVMGKNNRIFAGAVLGGIPQDKKYAGEITELEIGDNNQIRECVTMSTGTLTGGGITRMKDGNLIMAYTHFGHDVYVGSNNVIANAAQLAGHVTVDNNSIIGGSCAINQGVRIGSFSFIGGFSAINKDILPYCIAQGNYAVVRATNKIGLERNGFSKEVISEINKAIRIVSKGSHSVAQAIERIQSECQIGKEMASFLEFIKKSERGIAI